MSKLMWNFDTYTIMRLCWLPSPLTCYTKCRIDIPVPLISKEIRRENWCFAMVLYYSLRRLRIPTELTSYFIKLSWEVAVWDVKQSSIVSKLSANAEQMSGLSVGGTVLAHSVVCIPPTHTVDFCQWCASLLFGCTAPSPRRNRTTSSFVPVDVSLFRWPPLRGGLLKAFMFQHVVWQCITRALSVARCWMIDNLSSLKQSIRHLIQNIAVRIETTVYTVHVHCLCYWCHECTQILEMCFD